MQVPGHDVTPHRTERDDQQPEDVQGRPAHSPQQFDYPCRKLMFFWFFVDFGKLLYFAPPSSNIFHHFHFYILKETLPQVWKMFNVHSAAVLLLWIHAILVTIWIRRSVSLSYGSGACSFRQWLSFFKMPTTKEIFWHFTFRRYQVLSHQSSKIESHKEVNKPVETKVFFYFA